MPRPPVRDVIEIVDHVRRRGYAEYPLEAVPAPFEDWRRALRSEARRVGIRISVRRFDAVVAVFNPDHESTGEQQPVSGRAVTSVMSGDEPGYDDALARQRRAHLRVVRDGDTA